MRALLITVAVATFAIASSASTALAQKPPPQKAKPLPLPLKVVSSTEAAALEAEAQREEVQRIAAADRGCCDSMVRDGVITLEEKEQVLREGKCCERLKSKMEQLGGSSVDISDGGSLETAPAGKSFARMIVEMVVMLGGICLLAYVVLGKMLPRLMRIEPPATHRRILTVVDRLSIDPRRSIVILKIGELYYLVGVSEQGISLISRLDGDDVASAIASADLPKPTISRLAGVLMGRSQKES